jgi:hypothetical protein
MDNIGYFLVGISVLSVWGLTIFLSPVDAETPASNNLYVILANLGERIQNLEEKPEVVRLYSEFHGTVQVNSTGNILKIECGTDYPYYQYDSGFSRPDGGLLTVVNHQVFWNGNNDVWTTEYISAFQDSTVNNSIACSNIP